MSVPVRQVCRCVRTSGVPHIVYLMEVGLPGSPGACTAQPRSDTFRRPSVPIKTFSGLISAYKLRLSSVYAFRLDKDEKARIINRGVYPKCHWRALNTEYCVPVCRVLGLQNKLLKSLTGALTGTRADAITGA